MEDFEVNKYFQFGTKNPTLMDKPFWKFMICNPKYSALDIRNKIGASCELPIYSFARFGSTQTYLPDGRLVCIAGAHDIHGAKDFYIYNDVVVINNPKLVECQEFYTLPIPENFPQLQSSIEYNMILGTDNPDDVTIYGYPERVFEKTDSHTASYIRAKDGKEYIYIIGGTLCETQKHTRVYRLCLSDFKIERVVTVDDGPICCVHEHTAEVLTKADKTVISICVEHNYLKGCKLRVDKLVTTYELTVETREWRDKSEVF